MFNSPSAARATPRRAPRAPRTPSVFSERDALPPQSARSSRLAIVRQASPVSSAGETIRTARAEMEGYEKVYWSRDERRGVASLGSLPKDVAAMVKSSDFVHSLVDGHIDAVSGFAMITNSSGCKAWNYAKRTQSSPTTYTFPAPPLSRGYGQILPPVLAAFLSGSSTGEPGVVLVSATGEIRIWESMGMALSNVDRYQEVYIELGEDDYADKIWKTDGNNFIITTTSSLAFRLTVTSNAGRLVPSVTPLTRPGGMFGRASSTLFTNREDKNGVRAVIVREGEVYFMAGRTLQRWSLGAEALRWQTDFDLHEAIGSSLFEDTWSSGRVSIDLLDLAVVGATQLGVLIAYTEDEAGSSSSQNSATPSYAIVVLEIESKTGNLRVSRYLAVTYKPDADPRALDIGRLYIPLGSPMAFVRFATAVVAVSLSTSVPYEDVISLTEPNAIVAVGTRGNAKRSGVPPSIVMIPARGGLLSIEAYELSPKIETSTSEMSDTSKLSSRMEQAIYFGDRPDNPLSFTLPPGAVGDVAEAAEAVSADIVASRSPYLPSIFEIRPQLADRSARLRGLISFLRQNSLMPLIPQATRRRLLSDAEKVAGAIRLWEYQDRLMDQLNTRSPHSLLADSIAAHMTTIFSLERDDFVRSFFRTQVASLDHLLKLVFDTFHAATGLHPADSAEWVLEANKIYLNVLRTALILREDENAKYEIDRERPAIELWTSQEPILQAIEQLYFATQQAIAERTRVLGTVVDEAPSDNLPADLREQQQKQSLLKNQMAALAAALCANMEDKVRHALRKQTEEGADVQEGLALKERWASLRPRIIRPLIDIDRADNAYLLAEHHRDWESLVFLCHHPRVGKAGSDVQKYIERHGEEFAFVLYQWYIDNNQQYALLTQDEVYGSLITKYFQIYGYPQLSWIHDIACRRFGEAASALLEVDGQTAELDQKHVLISIGKLAAVADIKTRGDARDRKQRLVDLDEELDVINVQDGLRKRLAASVPTRRHAKPSMETYASQYAQGLKGRPTFLRLFVETAQQLVDGSALDIEDLVDVLTMKDNDGENGLDPVIALERLVRDATLPDGRKQVALLSIWRRVFIRDDWAQIADTTGRSEESQRTMQRQTLTYRTVKALGDVKNMPKSFHLSPLIATQPPLPAELSARFPDWTPEELEALMADHHEEIRVLEKFIEKNGLEGRVLEVAELVRRDVSGMRDGGGVGVDVGEDVDM